MPRRSFGANRYGTKRLGESMRGPEGDKVKCVAEAMLKMVKLDFAGLEAAARG
jgi:hypothetical protein